MENGVAKCTQCNTEIKVWEMAEYVVGNRSYTLNDLHERCKAAWEARVAAFNERAMEAALELGERGMTAAEQAKLHEYKQICAQMDEAELLEQWNAQALPPDRTPLEAALWATAVGDTVMDRGLPMDFASA
jgi:hypothetical protein